MKLVSTLLLSLFIFGCSGTVYTVKNPQFEDGQTEGVLFHGYKTTKKKVIYDRIRHTKTGNITHSSYAVRGSDIYCAPVEIFKKIVVADYDTTYAIKYDSSLFETNTFSVGLENGTLKSINSESTPGVKTAVESLQGLATLREDILDGIAESSSAEAFVGLEGELSSSLPLNCSTNV